MIWLLSKAFAFWFLGIERKYIYEEKSWREQEVYERACDRGGGKLKQEAQWDFDLFRFGYEEREGKVKGLTSRLIENYENNFFS